MSFRTVEMRIGGYHLRDGDNDEFCWQDAVTELAAAADDKDGIFTFWVGNVPIAVNAGSQPQLLEGDVRFAELGYLVGAVGPAPRQYTDEQRELIRQIELPEHSDPNNAVRLELLRELHRLMVCEP